MTPVHHRVLVAWVALVLATPAALADEFDDARDAVNRGDFGAGLPTLRALADRGEPRAQNALGILYQRGRGVGQDDGEAARWYRKAAEQGNAWGEDNLGVMYRDGRGVPKDEAEAVRWFRRAAEHGNAEGQNNLAVMYQKGGGVAIDEAEAVLWYRKAADQGLALAQLNLGRMYSEGRGVKQDHAEAMRLFRSAAEQGNARAQSQVGTLYRNGWGVAQDDAEAVRWYRKAVESGDAQAQARLAYMYESGLGVVKDEKEALRWYWNAANQGDVDAQLALGRMYRDGRGAETNRQLALLWLGKAARQGSTAAQAAIDTIEFEDRTRAAIPVPKATAAVQPSLPAVDEERAALVREIMLASHAREKFEEIVQAAQSADLTKSRAAVPDAIKEALRSSLVEAFAPEAMMALVEANLATILDRDTLRAGLEWQRSSIGARMNDFERSARTPTRAAERAQLIRQLQAKGSAGDDTRTRACAQADALSEQTESFVAFLEVLVAGSMLADAELQGRTLDLASIERSVGTVRPLLRETARVNALGDCLSDYKYLSDAAFDVWLEFLRSPAGGRYVRGANAALRQAMVTRSAVLTQSLLEVVRRYKREKETS